MGPGGLLFWVVHLQAISFFAGPKCEPYFISRPTSKLEISVGEGPALT